MAGYEKKTQAVGTATLKAQWVEIIALGGHWKEFDMSIASDTTKAI